MDEILKRSRTSVDSWFKKLHPQLAGPFALKPVVMQECSSNRVWRRKVLLHGILDGQREKSVGDSYSNYAGILTRVNYHTDSLFLNRRQLIFPTARGGRCFCPSNK